MWRRLSFARACLPVVHPSNLKVRPGAVSTLGTMFLAKRSVQTAPLSGLFHVEQGLFHHQMPQRLFHVEQSAQELDPGQGTSTSIRSERDPRVDDYRLTEKVARGAAESYLPLAGGEMNQLRASRTVSGSGTHGGGRASSKDMTRCWRCQPAMHQIVMDGSKLKTAALGRRGFHDV